MPSSLDRVLRNVAVSGRAPLDAPADVVPIGGSPSDAFDRGFAEGAIVGRREGAAMGETAAAGVQAALEGVRADLAELRFSQAEATLSAAIEVAELILGRLPEIDRVVLVERLGRALQALDDDPLVVLLNPADRDAFGEELGRRFDVEVEADPTLGPGEARVRGAWGRADLTRQTALAVVREALT